MEYVIAELRMLTIEALDHIVFDVRDVDTSADWYERVLGMKRVDATSADGEHRTSMTFGQNKINLRPIAASQESWFTGKVPTAGGQDFCFLTDTSPEAVAAHFQSSGVDIELGPVTKSGALGPICSVYVRDPDGNLIEVSSYV
jgi:catechol 2,3-dioxygenase-like lactoylglutathione lyase family enzyme